MDEQAKALATRNFGDGDQEFRQELIKDIPRAAQHIEFLAKLCFGLGLTAGWWHDAKTKEPKPDRNYGDLTSLFHSEISEAYEHHRKGSKDDHLPQYDGKVVELMDLLIRVFDYIGSDEKLLNEAMGAIVDKLIYNTERADHKMDARAADGGKKL